MKLRLSRLQIHHIEYRLRIESKSTFITFYCIHYNQFNIEIHIVKFVFEF